MFMCTTAYKTFSYSVKVKAIGALYMKAIMVIYIKIASTLETVRDLLVS